MLGGIMDLRGHIFVNGPIVDPLWSPLNAIYYHFLGGSGCVGFTTERGKKVYNYNKVDPERDSQ